MTPKGDEAESLARWRANVANGSQLYADVSYRRLLAFCKDARTTPTEVAVMEVDALRRLLEDYLAREKKRGHTGGYIGTTLKAVRSWRVYHGKPIVAGIKLPNTTLSPRVDQESMPTPEDLRRVLLAATPKERVSISLMAFSGVRPQVIGSYEGTDGLVLGDLPELKVEGATVSFEKTPTLVRVRAKNSKTKNAYFTFIGEEGCLAIKQYLEERLIGGEKLGPTSDLVHPDRMEKRFVTTTKIGVAIRRAMRAAGLDQRPYVWRAYFLSRLLEASNAGKVSDRYTEFWAGHTGDVTSKHYTTGRANLSASMIEDMRAAYKRCEKYLSTIPTGDEKEEMRALVRAEVLKSAGYKPEEAEQLAADPKSNIADLVAKKLGAAAVPQIQRIVSVDEATPLLATGWKVLTSVGADRLVLNPPN